MRRTATPWITGGRGVAGVGLLLVIASSLPVFAAEPPPRQVRVYGLAERFVWEEKLQGQRLLEEDGPRFGLGADFAAPLNPTLWLHGRFEVFIGQVTYDGGLQLTDGSIEPYRSHTTYHGLRGALLAATPITTSPRTVFWPLGGLGAAYWLRTLDTKLGDADIGPFGYEEYWGGIQGILGGRLDWQASPRQTVFLQIEGHLPIWNREVADLSNVGGPSSSTLAPRERPSLYGEIGWRQGRLGISGYVQTFEYDASEPNRDGFFQPDSSGYMAGVKVGAAF